MTNPCHLSTTADSVGSRPLHVSVPSEPCWICSQSEHLLYSLTAVPSVVSDARISH